MKCLYCLLQGNTIFNCDVCFHSLTPFTFPSSLSTGCIGIQPLFTCLSYLSVHTSVSSMFIVLVLHFYYNCINHVVCHYLLRRIHTFFLVFVFPSTAIKYVLHFIHILLPLKVSFIFPFTK